MKITKLYHTAKYSATYHFLLDGRVTEDVVDSDHFSEYGSIAEGVANGSQPRIKLQHCDRHRTKKDNYSVYKLRMLRG